MTDCCSNVWVNLDVFFGVVVVYRRLFWCYSANKIKLCCPKNGVYQISVTPSEPFVYSGIGN